jgi:hypothetical protein
MAKDIAVKVIRDLVSPRILVTNLVICAIINIRAHGIAMQFLLVSD